MYMTRFKYVILLALLVAMLMWLWNWLPTGSNDNQVSADTLRVVVYDTIPYYMPVPKEEKPLGDITARLPISRQEDLAVSADSVPALSNGLRIGKDSVNVQIPITQKVYEDSTYRAYVSGYRASLDSLLLFPQREVITIKAKPKRWSVGLQVGWAVVYDGQWRGGPGVMIGLSYRF